MEKLTLCRVCLNANVHHVIINTHLEIVYEKLTAMPFQTNDTRPLSVCYLCHAQLQNTKKLMLKCLTAETLFTEIMSQLADTEEKADDKATLIDRLRLGSALSVTPIVTLFSTYDNDDQDRDVDLKIKQEIINEQVDDDVENTDDGSEAPITNQPELAAQIRASEVENCVKHMKYANTDSDIAMVEPSVSKLFNDKNITTSVTNKKMAQKKNYSPLQMAQAIEAVRKGEKIATAAKKFGVPRITLHDKISGKTPVECSMGAKTYLSTEEEAILVKWVLEMADKHILVTRDELLDSVQRIIIDQKKTTPFTDNRPGRKWYNLFLNRHPTLSERMAQNLTTARDAATEENIRHWFVEVESYLHEKNLTDILEEPARIFNTDENALFLSPKVGKVLARKGEKHICQSSGDEKDNLTVLITGNAAGQLAPPMVVFAYESIPSTISFQFPEDWAFGRSQSGWMCGSTFYEYIVNIFNPWLLQQNIRKPVVFFLDGHRSHLTLHLSNFCAENGIEIIALHPNSTHILQPMDMSIFRPLKTYWIKAVKDWKLQHLGQNLKKENFALVLKTALQSITADSIKNGFRAGGLYPFGPEYVDLTKVKSRQKQQVSAEQANFFNYLEKETVVKLGSEKLQYFKELFYKGHNEFNSLLNEEDASLYIIWASNKQSGGQESKETTNNTSIIDKLSFSNMTDLVATASTSCSSTRAAAESTTSKETTRPEPKENSNDILIVNMQNSSNQVINPLQSALNCKAVNVGNNSTITLNENSDVETTSSKETITHESKEKSNETLIINQLSNQTIVSLQLASTSSMCIQSILEKTPIKEMTTPGVGNTYISSPFKTNLFRPGEYDTKGEKRKLREKVTPTITSKRWRDCHEVKDKQKIEIAKQKEIKAQEREAKRQSKQKEMENKKQNRLKHNENKKKKLNRISNPKPNDTSSDNIDSKVNYAESDDSCNMEIKEEIIDEDVNKPLSNFFKPV